jgi:lactate racemase
MIYNVGKRLQAMEGKPMSAKVKLAYGRSGLMVNFPDGVDILQPRFVPGLPDEQAALAEALRHPRGGRPLAELVRPGQTVVIVHTDITRATPNARLLPVLLQVLEAAGIRDKDITLLNGLGTHRPQTEAELRQLLGLGVVERYRCLQHDCNDEANLIALGETELGHRLRVNRAYMEADVKLLTGFIEPHFFAGFSGGPKAVLPSLAGAESVFTNHGYQMLAHPKASWGITEGNPIWEEMRDAALRTQPDFLVNVTLNTRHEMTGVFAGELLTAHGAGCEFVKATAMVPVAQPYDVVVTTNSGYPLDQNLYQSVKGMSAAARIVRPGGAIFMVAACEDGVPNFGLYGELLERAGSPAQALAMIAAPGFQAQDQWQVQIQAQVQLQADVYVYSEGLSEQQIRRALLRPSLNVEETLRALVAEKGNRVCVLPDGPQTIPYLTHEG